MYGYARVSTADQNPQLQFDALLDAGVKRDDIYTDYVSGAKERRPSLDDLLAVAGSGDTIVVWKLDRLGRSTSHLIDLVQKLNGDDVEFKSLRESIDTTTPGGRLIFRTFASLAEFERDLIIERTQAGLAAARASGKQLGRKASIRPGTAAHIRELSQQGLSQREIADRVNVSASAVGRLLRGEIQSLRVRKRDKAT